MTASFAPRPSRTRPRSASSSSGSGAAASIQFGSPGEPCSRIPLKAEIASLLGHQRYQFIRMDKFIPEAGIGLGIEYLFEPIDDDLVPIGVAKFLVVGQPQIHVIIDPEIDRDQRRAERNHRRRQKSDPRTSFDRIENRDTRIRRYADDPFQRFQSQNSRVAGLVELNPVLLDDAMIPEVRERRRQPI